MGYILILLKHTEYGTSLPEIGEIDSNSFDETNITFDQSNLKFDVA